MAISICFVYSNDESAVVVLTLGAVYFSTCCILIWVCIWECKFECFGSWQAVVLACLVMSVMSGVQLSFIHVIILALLVVIFGAHSELTVPMSGVRIV